MNKYPVLIIVASLISPKHFLSGTPQFEATKRLSLPYTPTIQTARWHPRLNKLAILACDITKPPDSENYTLQFHDLQSEEHTNIACSYARSSSHPIAWHPTQSTIACGWNDSNTTALYNTSGTTPQYLDHTRKRPTFCSTLKKYGLIAALSQTVLTQERPEGITSVHWSKDGSTLASASQDYTIYLSDPRTLGICQQIPGHQQKVTDVAFNPDNGHQLASSSYDSTVQVWDIRSSKKSVAKCSHINPSVSTVCWNPDGTQLASGSHDTNICLWQILPTVKHLNTLVGHTDHITSLSWHPNDSILASGSGYFLHSIDVPLRHVDQPPCIIGEGDQAIDVGGNYWVDPYSYWGREDGLPFKKSGQDHSVRLWDSSTAECTQVLQGHTGHINSVEWSPDGSQLASSSHDGTVVVWEPKREKKIHTPPEKQKTPPPSKLMSFITTALKWIPLGV